MARAVPYKRVLILQKISRERLRQEEKWGDQSNPDGTCENYAGYANLARDECNQAAAIGTVTWRHILFEEYAEAVAECDPEKLKRELIEVAAVCVSWIEDLDRRQAEGIDSVDTPANRGDHHG